MIVGSRHVLIGVAFALVAVACAPPADQTTNGTGGSNMESPQETVWRWTTLTGADGLTVLHPNRYTLELLQDDRYAVRADCNSGGGSYSMDEDRLKLEPGPMTMAACPPDSLGGRYAALLGGVGGFAQDGDRLGLDLDQGAGTMEFEAMKPISLAGTSWLVRAYNNGKKGVVSVAAGTTLHATFGEDGRVAGSAGCNTFSAGFEVDGQAISIGLAATTRMMCPEEGVMEQESAFLAALSTASAWENRGERLTLRTAAGSVALDFVSAITGTVTYRTRQALPPDARITVQLQDVSLADAPAVLLGEQVIAAEGRQVPFAFEIAFDPSAIDPRHSYSVRATIEAGGELLLTSTQAYPVITRDAPRYGIEIVVQSVR